LAAISFDQKMIRRRQSSNTKEVPGLAPIASLAPSGETLASRTKKTKKMRIGNEEPAVVREPDDS
jgi:hypothetical protein